METTHQQFNSLFDSNIDVYTLQYNCNATKTIYSKFVRDDILVYPIVFCSSTNTKNMGTNLETLV